MFDLFGGFCEVGQNGGFELWPLLPQGAHDLNCRKQFVFDDDFLC